MRGAHRAPPTHEACLLLALWLGACSGPEPLEIDLSIVSRGSAWFAVWAEGPGFEEALIVDTALGPPEDTLSQWSRRLEAGESVRFEVASYEVSLDDWNLEPGLVEPHNGGAGLPPAWTAHVRIASSEEDSGWLPADRLPARLEALQNARLPNRCPSFAGWEQSLAPAPLVVGQGAFVAADERYGWSSNDYELYRVDAIEGTWTKTATLPVPITAIDLDRRRQRLWLTSYELSLYYIDLDVDPARVIEVPLSQAIVDELHLTTVSHRARRLSVLEQTGEVLIMTSSSYLVRYRDGQWQVVQDGDPSGRGTFAGTLLRLSDTEAVYSRYPPGGIQFYATPDGPGRVELETQTIVGLAHSERFGLLAGSATPASLLARDEAGNWNTLEPNLGVPLEQIVDQPDGMLIRTQTGSGDPRLLKRLNGRAACGVAEEDLPKVERFVFDSVEGPIGAIWPLGSSVVVQVIEGLSRRHLLLRAP